MPPKHAPDTIAFTNDVLAMLPIDKIRPADDNLRADLGDLTELIASVKSIGILSPITVRSDGDEYLLVAGHRRHAAATAAGLAQIPGLILSDLNDVMRQEAMIVENLQRKDLNPVEEAEGYARLVELGLTQRDIAERVGFSQSHVAKRLSLRRLPPAATSLFVAGRLGIRQAEQLAGAEEDDIAELVAQVERRAEYLTTARGTASADEPLPDWIVGEAIRKLSDRRKHDKAEETGIASGLKRLDTRPYEYAGSHRPCPKTKATHWYLGDTDVSIIWARTAKAEAKEREQAIADEPEPEWQRQNRLTAAYRERTLAALARIGRLIVGGDDDLAERVHTWAQSYMVDRICDDTRGRFTRLEFDWPEGLDTVLRADLTDQPADLIAFTALVSTRRVGYDHAQRDEPLLEALQILVDHGYRAGEGETLPDTIVIPQESAAVEQPLPDEFLPQPKAPLPITIPCCARCDQPADCIDPDTQEPLCDGCWEGVPPITPAPAEGPAVPPTPAERIAQADARREDTVRHRIAELPDAQRAWMENIWSGTSKDSPIPHYHSTPAPKLLERIGELADVAVCRAIVAVEVHRSEVAGGCRPDIVNAALERIAELRAGPDEADVRQAALDTGKPMLDDDGEPIIADDHDHLARNEAAGRIPPERPWNTYGTAGGDNLLKAIATATKPAKLEAAIEWEQWWSAADAQDGDEPPYDRARIVIALRDRLAELGQ